MLKAVTNSFDVIKAAFVKYFSSGRIGKADIQVQK
jgi:hypothetical protein